MRVAPNLFAVGASCTDLKSRKSPFSQATRVTLIQDDFLPPTVELFCIDEHLIHTYYDTANGRAIYLWGRAAHPAVSRSELLQWCGNACCGGDVSLLREVYGSFVLIVDDRRSGRVHFASDLLAIRPWFVRTGGDCLAAGSDVLALHDSGYSSGQINYTAVSDWFRYNYDCSEGSILADYRLIAAGSVSTYNGRGERLAVRSYRRFTAESVPLSPADAVAGVHERVRRAFEVMTRDVQVVTLPLSGGYDSRYLGALAYQRPSLWTTAVNVQSNKNESTVAAEVARALKQPLKTLPLHGHVLDLFDDPFAFSRNGFPNGRNLASAVARRHPGTPILSGFLGDLLVRGSGDRCLHHTESAYETDQLPDIVHQHHSFKINRLDLLRGDLATRIDARARESIASVCRQAPAADKTFVYVNLMCRQRFYIANIFLQHLDSAEAILPFYSWDLVDFKLRHSADSFAFNNYAKLFATYFPRLASIPHSSAMKKEGRPAPRIRHMAGWAWELLKGLVGRGDAPTLIDRRKLLRRIPAGLAQSPARQDEILFLFKVHLLERALLKRGLLLDSKQF